MRDLAFALNPFQCRRPNRTLRELSLWGNLAGDDGVSALADMLMHNSTLEFLGLGRNGLTSESGKHISRALQHNRSLTSLDLRVNALGDSGVFDFTQALAQNTRIITINLIENGLRNSVLQDAQFGLIPLLRSVQSSLLVYVALQPGEVCDIQAKPLFGTKEYLLSWIPPFKRWGSMAAGAAPAMARTGVFTSFRTVGEHFNRVVFGMTNRFSSEFVNNLRLICQSNFLNYLSQHLTPDLSQRLVELYSRRRGSTVINEAWIDKSLLDQEHTTSVVSSLRSQEKVLFAIIARNPEFYDNYFRKIHSKYNDVFAEFVEIESRYIHTLTLLLKYRDENEETKNYTSLLNNKQIKLNN